MKSQDIRRQDATETRAPEDGQAEGAEVCFEVVEVLDGFVLSKRSDSLEGSIPLRAAQGCKPLLDGNQAGFHLSFAGPVVIRRGRGGPALALTDEGFDRFLQGYDEKLEADVEAGRRAGANAYVVKPDAEALVSTVKRLLEETQETGDGGE